MAAVLHWDFGHPPQKARHQGVSNTRLWQTLSFLHDYATDSNDIDNVCELHFLSQLLHRQARVTAMRSVGEQ
jgi:hypothetical protein